MLQAVQEQHRTPLEDPRRLLGQGEEGINTLVTGGRALDFGFRNEHREPDNNIVFVQNGLVCIPLQPSNVEGMQDYRIVNIDTYLEILEAALPETPLNSNQTSQQTTPSGGDGASYLDEVYEGNGIGPT